LLQQLDPNSEKMDNVAFARLFYPKDALVVSSKKKTSNTAKQDMALIDA